MRKHCFAILLGLAVFSGAAQAAAVQVDFLSTSLTGAPGDTLQFFATLTNTTAADITIAGVSVSSVSLFLTIDPSPLFFNFILPTGVLPAGQSTAQFEIFDILSDPATPFGAYVGNGVSILDDSFNSVADTSVDVILPAPASAPEPGSALLFASAALAAIIWACFRPTDASSSPHRR
jgi:hypothetical protein